MSKAIEGTSHTVSLHRDEEAILNAIRHTPGVLKLKPMWVTWTGPSRLRLDLRQTHFPWLVEGQLFIGSGKRYCHLLIDGTTPLEMLRDELDKTLSNVNVQIQIKGAYKPMQVTTNGHEPSQHSQVEDLWAKLVELTSFVRQHDELEEEKNKTDRKIQELVDAKDFLLLSQEELRQVAVRILQGALSKSNAQ